MLHYSDLKIRKGNSHCQVQAMYDINEDREAIVKEMGSQKKAIIRAKPDPPSVNKVPVFGTSMKNIPHKIDNVGILLTLRRNFPYVFDHDDVTCTKYDEMGFKNKTQTVAVVARARGQINHLHRESFQKQLWFEGTPYNYVFLPDFGVERNSTGNRLNPVHGTAFHVVREREGPQMRHGIKLFTQDFRNKLPETILNKLGPSVFWFDHPSFTNKNLPVEGLYRVRGGRNPEKQMFSASELEAIQMIRYMNGSKIDGNVVVFRNTKEITHSRVTQNGSNKRWEENKANNCVISKCNDHQGLGIGGSLIIFDEFTHSIPLSWIDNEIINNPFIKSFSLTCYRCDKNYKLVATSCNLDYLMAKCGCTGPCLSYAEWNSKPLPNNSPYHHPGEVHTRLAYNLSTEPNETLVAIPYLYKISNDYPSIQFMCNVLLPILEAEWRATQDASFENMCKATVYDFEILGKLDNNTERRIFHLIVNKNRFWSLHKCTGYKEVSMECTVKIKDNIQFCTVNERGYLSEAREYSETELLLLYDVKWPSQFDVDGNICNLTPHADKREYMFIREYLEKLPQQFKAEDSSKHVLSRLFITGSPSLTQKYDTVESVTGIWSAPIQNLYKKLNREQADAFKQSLSLEKGVNIIQGPPGTGKSFLISAIALALYDTKSGKVLCTGSSNVACDVMYGHIKNIATEMGITVNVCRIYSKGREVKLARKQVDHEKSYSSSKNKMPMRTLHNLVAADDEYLSGSKNLGAIDQLIREGNAYKMSKQESELYRRHVLKIERKILANEHIIIMTTGSLASLRIGKEMSQEEMYEKYQSRKNHHHGHRQHKRFKKENNYAEIVKISGRKENREKNEMTMNEMVANIRFSSVLVDEAGIISKIALLSLETFDIPRIILVGDHLQLQPQILSRSAEEAGLVRSLMELLIVDRKDIPVPMTMLKVQFRAHSDIRKLTSTITYRDQLRDDNSILYRREILKRGFFDSFPLLKKSRVWMLNHNGNEKRSGRSRANESEAEIVVDTVKDFIHFGHLQSSDVVVLAAYDGQRTLIHDKLAIAGLRDVLCKNVDDFQGNEATCIILSITRSNYKNNLGFLMVGNRVNVAISRARELLVVCMNLEMLLPFKNSNSHLGKLYRFFVERDIVTNVSVHPSQDVRKQDIE